MEKIAKGEKLESIRMKIGVKAFNTQNRLMKIRDFQDHYPQDRVQ